MKATVKTTAIAILVSFFAMIQIANGQEYRTNTSGSWETPGLWSVKNNSGWQIMNSSMDLVFPNSANNLVFNVLASHTVYIDDNVTVIFNGRNVKFNIEGLLIVNGNMEFKGNNTDLKVNGNMIINGTVSISSGGNAKITGDGAISVSEGGTFNWGGSPFVPGNTGGVSVVIGTDTDVCAPFALAASVHENGDKYDIELNWAFEGFDSNSCNSMQHFSHFEVTRNKQIIALIEATDITPAYTYLDRNLNASDNPSYAVTAIYTNPARRSAETTVEFNSALPIELMYFATQSTNNSVELTWATAAEINNDFFTIERSIDGNNWEIVSLLNGAGNSNYTIAYSYTDNMPYEGVSYYRLKQTDFDGQFEYFAPVAVQNTTNIAKTEIVTLRTSSNRIQIQYLNETPNANIIVADVRGRIISHINIEATDFVQDITVELPGNYTGEFVMVRLLSNEKSDDRKIMVR